MHKGATPRSNMRSNKRQSSIRASRSKKVDEDEEPEWQKTGSKHIGKRVRRNFVNSEGEIRVLATITAWLPAHLNDGQVGTAMSGQQ